LRAIAPRDAGPAILRGEAIAGIVPVGGLAELGTQVEMLGAYGISCPGPAQSVLFFSYRPFDELAGSDRIRLPTDSMSSVRLLYLLLAYRRGGRGAPCLGVPGESLAGELIIGDAALRMQASGRYPYATDLAARWQAQHGLPMVFARWVIQRSAPRALRARLQWWLAAFAASEPRLRDCAAAEDHARTGLTAVSARAYLEGIRTALRPEDLHGQQRYLDDLARYPLPSFLATPKLLPAQESLQR
jgi:chorismate dehydratase